MQTNNINVLSNVQWFELNDFIGLSSKKGYVFKSRTCNCKKGTDWLKTWVEAQHNIYVEKCFVDGQ